MTLALVLFVVSALFAGLTIVHFYQAAFAGLYLLLHLWFAVRAARGRQGSRIGVTITTAVAWIMLAPILWRAFSASMNEVYALEYAMLGLLGMSAGTIGVILLYTRKGNAHFVPR
ncbi:hypothetical protein AB0K18_47565 [Nonomuraea sp. NPDC049421]|uniref:hypothetical protein n=1 Tax=Nonomuraea sp. NPDC049421 TaxID=3155275 RepID=UPI00342E1B20